VVGNEDEGEGEGEDEDEDEGEDESEGHIKHMFSRVQGGGGVQRQCARRGWFTDGVCRDCVCRECGCRECV
jgi:hypothetical protein